MSKTKKNRKYILAEGVNDSQCFSCGKNKNKNFERHHFPRSHVAGGETYVPLCGICHDMVDRYCLDDWQECLLDDIKDKLIHNLPILELMCGMMAIVKEQYDQIKAEEKKGKKLNRFDMAIIEAIEGKKEKGDDGQNN